MRDKQIPLSDRLVIETRQGALEDEAYSRGVANIAGLDEVGRGPLAGPVVAAAVILPRGFVHPGIKDSKLLSASQREKLAPIIKQNAVSWSLGIVEAEEIDRINIFNASFVAMAKALQCLTPAPDQILVDGKQMIPPEMFPTNKTFGAALPRQKSVIKGDRLCLVIAAASIVAKVTRDEIMVQLDQSYPEYGFAVHKGYASPSHLDALRRLGPSPVHRRSFQPVRDACVETAGSDDIGSLFDKR
jgi:ribonuclease HII